MRLSEAIEVYRFHRAPGRDSSDPAASHSPVVARAARQKGAAPSGTAPFDPIRAAQ
jgi:hypothetical protein